VTSTFGRKWRDQVRGGGKRHQVDGYHAKLELLGASKTWGNDGLGQLIRVIAKTHLDLS